LPYFRDKDVSGGGVNRNEMVIRVQPNEAMCVLCSPPSACAWCSRHRP
jgi:hypothetical protein